ASGHWKLHYNILDFELSRQFYVGKWLSIRPKMGLRAAWINQHFNVKYHSIFVTTAGAFPFDQSFRCHQEFNGVGIKFGSDLQFYMNKAWSILGNLSTSLLWGETELKQKVAGRIFVDTTNSFPETIRFTKSVNKIRTNLEGLLGLQWQTYYHQDKYRFGVSALYSFAYWFSQNQLTNHSITPSPSLEQPAVVDNSANGDLQLQGLNFQLEFDF
ncbi:MAG: Lpg1974 family pore-forming outer membrane protein, partial [Parachlamydiales bacterium]